MYAKVQMKLHYLLKSCKHQNILHWKCFEAFHWPVPLIVCSRRNDIYSDKYISVQNSSTLTTITKTVSSMPWPFSSNILNLDIHVKNVNISLLKVCSSKYKCINVLQSPDNSPNLNRIKNFWSFFSKHLAKKTVQYNINVYHFFH